MFLCESLSISALTGLWEQILAAALILFVGWMWGRWRSILAWHKKQFRDRVLLSLNCLNKQDDKTYLKLRTLFERDIHEVFQNDNMEKIVQKAIEQTTESDPLLRLPQEDGWYVLNAVLNRISEEFASGMLRKDMGLEVVSKWYTFCLTFEKEGGLRIQKLRVMLVEKDRLAEFPENIELDHFVFESEKHKGRIQTLRFLKQELQKNPNLFMHIELCM
jgi:hypothetical protein